MMLMMIMMAVSCDDDYAGYDDCDDDFDSDGNRVNGFTLTVTV